MSDPLNTDAESTVTSTRWAIAVGEKGEVQKEALSDLAASYWYCVYAWWRRAGMDAAGAATATVASFTRWLGDFPPDPLDSGAARMREWLPARLAELAEEGVDVESDQPGALEIDAEWAEQRYAIEPAGDPDPIFQRVWALTLLEFTVSTLRTEYAGRREDVLFAELLSFSGFDSADDDRYAAAGERVGCSSGAMRKAVFEFRTRQREVLRAIATDTLRDPADTDNELTILLCAIDAPGIDATPLPSTIWGLRPEEALVRAMQSVRMTGAGRGQWEPPSDAEVARLFPQYEVLGLIGRGGMGAVYKARQRELDRIVAIKLLPLEVSVDRDFSARFRREARAMGKLSHPHIIAVFDFGTTSEGHLFFVMEFVEGANLHDMIRKVGIEPAQALIISAQVCTALAYAHEKGIVHRDIKPANVMVDLAGQAKVADFGLARLSDTGTGYSGYTVTGAVLGTPDYMAPEQKHGTPVDHRADIYSVGVMLYEMLCGETPQGAFDPPSKRIGCDTRIDTIVLKAMQQAPDRRYQSTQEMRVAVASALTPVHPAPARRFGPSPPLQNVEPPRRSLPLFQLSLVIVAAIAAFLIYAKSKGQREATVVPDNEKTEAVLPVPPALTEPDEPTPLPSEVVTSEPVPKNEDPPPASPVPSTAPTPPAPQSETAKWLAVQVPQWQAAYADEVSGPFEKGVAALNKLYLSALESQLAAFARAAKLNDAVAFRAERDRITSGGAVPTVDEPTDPTSLKTLRASYRASFNKLDTERFAKAKVVHARYDAILQQSQTALTQRQRLDEALEMKSQREALSAAWLQPPRGIGLRIPAAAVATPPKPLGAESAARAPVAAAATIKDPFINSLGMKLVPVPGTNVLFCIHETRRKDYAAYAAQVSFVNEEWMSQQYEGVPAGDQDDHPVVGVSWEDAQAFCTWLSQKEGKAYRLPTDEEWTIAVGLGRKERFGRNVTPESLHMKEITEFPWAGNFPPRVRDNAGNYADKAWHEKFPNAPWLEGYSDGFATTAPVMSFKPNKIGLYDMGGNVWEHVEDWLNNTKTERVSRGASFYQSERDSLLSSYRLSAPPNGRYFHHGFRIVVENRLPANVAATPAKPGAAATAPWASRAGAPALYPPASSGKPALQPTLVSTPKQPWQDPLRAAGVESKNFGKLADGTWVVDLDYATIADLKPLAGVPITRLRAGYTYIVDLSPLRGMVLKELWIANTKVTDLSPLKGMQLEVLSLEGTPVTDLSVLRGMPLTTLKLHDCLELTDLGALADIKGLADLTLPPNARDIEFLRTFPKLERLSFTVDRQNGERASQTTAEFWAEYDTQGWLRTLRATGVAIKTAKRLTDGTWEVDLSDTTFSDLSLLKGAPVSRLHLNKTAVSDLSPLSGLPLNLLSLQATKVSDLAPLRGMPIGHLHIGGTAVTDLNPVRGMPLKYLWMDATKITDLAPLEGMQLRRLNLSRSKVKDLSVIRGMPLTELKLHLCNEITDISPLAECKELSVVSLPPNAKNIDFLRDLPKLTRLSFTESASIPIGPAAEFWLQHDTQGWLRTLRESGVHPHVARQLTDGTWELNLSRTKLDDLTILKGLPISILNVGETAVSDLMPLRGMPMNDLKIFRTKVTDLSPLQGMPIRQLHLGVTKVTDISALRGMPLTYLKLHDCPSLTDISPITDAKELTALTLPPKPQDVEFLRSFPKLERLSFKEDSSANNYRPDKTAPEFWQEYDAKKK
jgi:serine/threonine protein kinase/Leucine-rich repeat (LRR) protein